MGRKGKCKSCNELRERLVKIENKFQALDDILKIYSLREVLEWRKHITQWDTWLNMYPIPKSLRLVYQNLTNIPTDMVEMVIDYGDFK